MAKQSIPPYSASVIRCEGQDLKATDFKNDRMVLVEFEHDHGQLLFPDAFVREDPEDSTYVWVMTEHMGYHVFARDELRGLLELHVERRVPVGELTGALSIGEF